MLAMIGNSSVNSAGVITATRAPRCGSNSTMPSAASTFSASRSGVREMSKRRHSSRSGNLLPRRKLAGDDHVLEQIGCLAVQRAPSNGSDLGHRDLGHAAVLMRGSWFVAGSRKL